MNSELIFRPEVSTTLTVVIVGGSRVRIVGETRVQTRARTAGETRVHTVGGSSAHIVRGSRVRIIGGSSVHIVGGSRVRIVGESRVRIVGESRVRIVGGGRVRIAVRPFVIHTITWSTVIRPFVMHTITWSTLTTPSSAKNEDGCKAEKPSSRAENAGEILQFKSRRNSIGHDQGNKDAKHLNHPLGTRKSVEAFIRSHFRNLTHKGEFIS